jgi:hypothetical protein
MFNPALLNQDVKLLLTSLYLEDQNFQRLSKSLGEFLKIASKKSVDPKIQIKEPTYEFTKAAIDAFKHNPDSFFNSVELLTKFIIDKLNQTKLTPQQINEIKSTLDIEIKKAFMQDVLAIAKAKELDIALLKKYYDKLKEKQEEFEKVDREQFNAALYQIEMALDLEKKLNDKNISQAAKGDLKSAVNDLISMLASIAKTPEELKKLIEGDEFKKKTKETSDRFIQEMEKSNIYSIDKLVDQSVKPVNSNDPKVKEMHGLHKVAVKNGVKVHVVDSFHNEIFASRNFNHQKMSKFFQANQDIDQLEASLIAQNSGGKPVEQQHKQKVEGCKQVMKVMETGKHKPVITEDKVNFESVDYEYVKICNQRRREDQSYRRKREERGEEDFVLTPALLAVNCSPEVRQNIAKTYSKWIRGNDNSPTGRGDENNQRVFEELVDLLMFVQHQKEREEFRDKDLSTFKQLDFMYKACKGCYRGNIRDVMDGKSGQMGRSFK